VSIIRVDRCVADPGFVLSYLTHPIIKSYIESFNAGGSRRAITKGHIESFRIALPPLAEQRAIAHILGTLDDKIELNQRMNETLEAMARALFKLWFVDFEPVRAKVDGEQPLSDGDCGIAVLFANAFAAASGEEVPRGWRVGLFGDDFDVRMGQSPPGETYNLLGDGSLFFQGCADFGFRYPTARVYCTAPTRWAEPGDTLVSVRAPVGSINMAAQRCCVGRGVAAIRHKTGSRSYTYYAMASLDNVFARFEAEGTVFGSISKRGLTGVECLIPPTEVVHEFEQLVFPLDQSIEHNERQSQTLTAIRNALLPKLLSGQIRVREAGRAVAEVV
jgi:type I restriction enzyme S subunit